jgi:hypothetical protein
MDQRVEPWRQRDDWTSGWLKSATGGRDAVVFLWIFSLVWNAASGYAMVEVYRGNATGHVELAPICLRQALSPGGRAVLSIRI